MLISCSTSAGLVLHGALFLQEHLHAGRRARGDALGGDHSGRVEPEQPGRDHAGAEMRDNASGVKAGRSGWA